MKLQALSTSQPSLSPSVSICLSVSLKGLSLDVVVLTFRQRKSSCPLFPLSSFFCTGLERAASCQCGCGVSQLTEKKRNRVSFAFSSFWWLQSGMNGRKVIRPKGRLAFLFLFFSHTKKLDDRHPDLRIFLPTRCAGRLQGGRIEGGGSVWSGGEG